MFPNNLSNAIVSLGGQVFDSILKVKGEGAYVQASQMNSLVQLLNRASFKLETLEEEVNRNETFIQILFGILALSLTLTTGLFYLLCAKRKDGDARMSTKIGSSMRTNIYQSPDEHVGPKLTHQALPLAHPRTLGSASGSSLVKDHSNLTFSGEEPV